jgi:endoglucanase
VKRGSRLLAFAILVIAAWTSVAGAASAAPAAPSFKRGATLVELFQFPQIAAYGPIRRYADPAYPNARAALSLFDFDELRRDGFDHMRLLINVGPLLAGDGAQWDRIIGDLRFVIAALNRHGLGVLVTLLPPAPGGEVAVPLLDGLHGPRFERYVTLAQRIAAELAAVKSGVVALEPMNEPQTECRASSGPDWTDYQEILVAQIRRVASELPLFLTGGCWSSIEGTVLLDTPLLRDPRNFVSVHFYIPFMFTHQTATWAMPFIAGVIGLPYPAADGNLDDALALTRERFQTLDLSPDARQAQFAEAERAIRWYFSDEGYPSTIETWMGKLAEWQRREGVPSDRIVFTEFGAMKQLTGGNEINRLSRARWLHDASAAFERHGWGWTVYVLRDGPFGLFDSNSDHRPDPGLLTALGLAPVAQRALH